MGACAVRHGRMPDALPSGRRDSTPARPPGDHCEVRESPVVLGTVHRLQVRDRRQLPRGNQVRGNDGSEGMQV